MSFSVVKAQDDFICATIEPSTPDTPGDYSYSTDLADIDDCDPIVLNVKIWGVNRPDGTNNRPNRPNDALQAVANLNILFNEFGIYFKYRGYEEFSSPTVPGDPTGYYVLENTGQFSALVNWAQANGYRDPNAFNIYAYGWGTGFGGIAYYRSLISGVSANGLGALTSAHEIAHNLDIRHPRSHNENATRDRNDPNFNADVAGDFVVDTNAHRGFWSGDPNNPFPNLDLNNCTYIGSELDPVQDPYTITNEDVVNLLEYAGPCTELYITPGQGIRAREAILKGYFNDAITDVASLYEPYAGEYYFAGPLPSPPNPPLFQPGFDYRFVECSGNYPQPADYNDTSFSWSPTPVLTISKYETDFKKITHPNHTAILIDLNVCNDHGQLVRRCYDNYNRNPKGGSITKFNDGVFNANVTVTPKDSLGINHPNLIVDLPEGLYKVEKEYDAGATQQTIIVKEN